MQVTCARCDAWDQHVVASHQGQQRNGQGSEQVAGLGGGALAVQVCKANLGEEQVREALQQHDGAVHLLPLLGGEEGGRDPHHHLQDPLVGLVQDIGVVELVSVREVEPIQRGLQWQ